MEDLTGKQLGQYRIVAPLGEGGMAAVYKAYQPGMDRYVALKILPRHFAAAPEFTGRFEMEARVVAKLQHPYILPVFDYGQADGYTFIVMPYIEGGTLSELLHGRPLGSRKMLQVISQVGDALDYAHSLDILHRDIKPSNIMIDERGNCLLTDFGIAKIVEGTTKFTQTGGIIGTPAYMSPEQGSGEKLDGRTDIYSLGVILYEMATGKTPFNAETPMAVVIKHIHDPLEPPRSINPDLNERVERIIFKSLSKTREDRYAAAGDMAAALRAAVEADEVLAGEAADRPTTTFAAAQVDAAAQQPAPRPARKWNWKWLVAAIAGLSVIGIMLLVVVLYGMGFLSPRITPEPSRLPVSEVSATPAVVSSPTERPAVEASATSLPPLTTVPEIVPARGITVFNPDGYQEIAPAETWNVDSQIKAASQFEIIEDPKGFFGLVGRLSVRGYGHGEQTAQVTLILDVPQGADIITLPVASGVNGPVDETDSESGLEIVVFDPQSGAEVATYASYLLETEFGVPYVFAFADVSDFAGSTVELTITLRQMDVCAGTLCTQDADFYLGDLSFASLPDICTTEADGGYVIYDYFDDPTPRPVPECEYPQPYYFLDVEYGPHNAYGAGEDIYTVDFVLPEGAQIELFRLYYGYKTRGMVINGYSFSPEEVYAAFPYPAGAYLNIPEPIRHALVNDNPGFVAPYLQTGENIIELILYTENLWEERPFDLFARFVVPAP